MRKTNLWCFLLLLALAAVPCAANELSGSITTDVTVQDVYLPFILCLNSNFTGCAPANANGQDVGEPPPGTYHFSGSIDGVQSGYLSVFALDVSNGDVIVGLNNGISAVGNPWPFSTPEATIASDLSGGDSAALATFFSDNKSYWLALSTTSISGGQLVEFSNGVSVGSLNAAIVPEPGSLWISMLMLVGAFLARRFRFLKKA